MTSMQVLPLSDLMELGRYEYALACAVIYAKALTLELVELVLPLVHLDSLPWNEMNGDLVWLQSYLNNTDCGALWDKLQTCRPGGSCGDIFRAEGEALATGADLILRMKAQHLAKFPNHRKVVELLHSAYVLFLHDRRLRVDAVTLQGIRQLGVFAHMDISAVPRAEPRLSCHLISCEFEFQDQWDAPPVGLTHQDKEYKAWRSRKLKTLGISDISLAEARSPVRRSGMQVIAMLFGPARFLNSSATANLDPRPQEAYAQQSSPSTITLGIAPSLLKHRHNRPVIFQGEELVWDYGSDYTF